MESSMTDKLRDPDGFYKIQYEDKLRRINKLLPAGSPLRVLDLGAGYGDYLRFMKEKGWETWGIEPSARACNASVLPVTICCELASDWRFSLN